MARDVPGEDELTTLSEDEQFAVANAYFIMNFFERMYLMYRDGDIEDQRLEGVGKLDPLSLTTQPAVPAGLGRKLRAAPRRFYRLR